MRDVLLVGIGGFVGAAARHLVGQSLVLTSTQWRFPVGTLLVNVLGCALIGVFAALAEHLPAMNGPARLLLVTGVLGGFTTFSAFGHEALTLLRVDPLKGTIFPLIHVAAGIAAVAFGRAAAAVALRS
jgi:CrcB protein